MQIGKFRNNKKKTFSIVLIEKAVQLLWYFFWIVVLIRQKVKPVRQPG